MTSEDAELVREAYALVQEGAHLFEFFWAARPSSLMWAEPTRVVNVLEGWFARGWLELVVDADASAKFGETPWWSRSTLGSDKAFRQLAQDDARSLLSDPASRLNVAAEGQVMVFVSATGEQMAAADWRAEVEPPPTT